MPITLCRPLAALAIALLCAPLLPACGDDSDGRSNPGSVKGDGSVTVEGGSVDAPLSDAPPPTDGSRGGSVSVMILGPMANQTLSGATVSVTALVTSQNSSVDTLSIAAKIDDGAPVHLTPTGQTDTFGGPLPIAALLSGRHGIRVSAATIDGATAAADVSVIVNAGPIITFLRPGANEPTNGVLTYDFQVRIAQELAGLQVGNVTATVGLCTVALSAPTGPATAREYTGSFDLASCSPTLTEGVQQLTVRAEDTSSPTPAAAVSSRVFIIDRTGPLIDGLAPGPAELVGGVINVSAHVTDPSGVQAATVFATISHGGTGFTVPLSPAGADIYTATFDTHRLPNPTIIQFPALEVVADDALGNHSRTGGILFTLDNVPPVGDLDPAPATLVKYEASVTPGTCNPGACKCSRPFDPVGDDAASDRQTVAQLFDLRAEIGDVGNVGPGSDVTFVAGVDRVTLYVLDDTSRPLVLDSDGDGICDVANPEVVPLVGMPPGPDKAVALSMVTIPSGGLADFVPSYSVPPFCAQGGDMVHPPKLCSVTLMTIALSSLTDGAPLIWTIPPVVGNDVQCQGLQFDALANNINDGWICVAAEFTDGVGNRSVSAPMRLCVDKSGRANCPDRLVPPPDCTGTLDRLTGQISSTPCTPVRVPSEARFVRG